MLKHSVKLRLLYIS